MLCIIFWCDPIVLNVYTQDVSPAAMSRPMYAFDMPGLRSHASGLYVCSAEVSLQMVSHQRGSLHAARAGR